jgi:hypothetical protein
MQNKQERRRAASYQLAAFYTHFSRGGTPLCMHCVGAMSAVTVVARRVLGVLRYMCAMITYILSVAS